MKTALEIVALLTIVLVAGAIGVLDDLGTLALLFAVGLVPLAVTILHIYGFYKAARADLHFAIGAAATAGAVVLLTFGGVLLLSNQIVVGVAIIIAAAACHFLFLKRASGCARMFDNQSLRQNWVSLPSAPGSRFITLPMVEMVLGIGVVLITTTTAVSAHYGIWAHVPAVVMTAIGYVFQVSNLMAVGIETGRKASN